MSLINGTTVRILDFEEVFVNYFAGSSEMFFFLLLIFLSYVSARFRMPIGIYAMIMVTSVIVLAGYGYTTFYIIILFVLGLLLYWIFSRLIKD